ncbi:hypothetical protein JGY85_00520 [Shigella sonnei]|nr:hypothetical protein [Shigella sonnei]
MASFRQAQSIMRYWRLVLNRGLNNAKRQILENPQLVLFCRRRGHQHRYGEVNRWAKSGTFHARRSNAHRARWRLTVDNRINGTAIAKQHWKSCHQTGSRCWVTCYKMGEQRFWRETARQTDGTQHRLEQFSPASGTFMSFLVRIEHNCWSWAQLDEANL